MNLYTFYSESHKDIYENYLLKSLRKNGKGFTLHVKKAEQKTKTGSFYDAGFNSAMKDKIKLILNAINANKDDWFVFADCDIQFLQPLYDDLNSYKDNDVDIIAQSDLGTLCAGFFMAKANNRIQNLMQIIYDNIESFHNDQVALNNYKDMVNYKLLDSDKYFTIANVNGGNVWNGETDLILPSNIIMHHANFTVGVENKIKLLNFVKDRLWHTE